MNANHTVNVPGNTPIVAIHIVVNHIPRTIYLKLESKNPTGSVKDRTGYALIQDLEQQHLIQKGNTLIESTSGNLGVALAALCKERGYGFVAVIDPKTTSENIAKMQSYSADIELVTHEDVSGGYLLSRLERVQALCQRHPNYVWSNQYGNAANPYIHYASTGPEIYQQLHGQISALFVAVSTGGTLAGVGRYFREADPTIKIIAVDAHGSVIFGTPPGPRKLTGIGSSRRSNFLRPAHYDSYMLVKDEEAFTFCRLLDTAINIKLGGSSGAVLATCVNYLAQHPETITAACICADGGENYRQTIYNDDWLAQHHFNTSHHSLTFIQDISLTHLPIR